MKNIIKKSLCVGLTVAMAAASTACGSSSSSSSSSSVTQSGTASETTDASAATTQTAETSGDLPVLGACIYSSDDQFNTYLASSIEKNAQGVFQCTVEDAENDQATMNNKVDAMLAKGAKAIALSLVDVSAAQTIIQKAQNAGDIPVIFFNKEVTDTNVLASYDNAYQVLSTAGGYGADIEAEQIAQAFKENDGGVTIDKNGDGVLQFVMLMGSADHTATIPRQQAIYGGLDAAGVKYEELACDYGDWDTAKAKEKMDAWVSKYGDQIEFIICANDAMAIGALQSIEAAGFNEKGKDSDKYIPIAGIDALPDTLNYIDSGEIYCSVLQDSSTQGELVVKTAANLVNGKDFLDGIDGYTLEPDKKAIRVPYKPIDATNTDEAKAGYTQ
jgi:methyl-galactoside transport system substrate-binding protein